MIYSDINGRVESRDLNSLETPKKSNQRIPDAGSIPAGSTNKYSGKTVSLTCHECGIKFDRLRKEVDRQTRNGNTRFFCSLSCVASRRNSLPHVVRANKGNLGALTQLNGSPELRAKALRKREMWKYVELEKLLVAKQLEFQFEFPLTQLGKHKFYDLALLDSRTLIEFDGHNHKFCSINKANDQTKKEWAEAEGWTLVRIPVQSSAVIDPSVLTPLLQ